MLGNVLGLGLEFGVEDWICLMMDIRILEGPEIDGARLRPFLLE